MTDRLTDMCPSRGPDAPLASIRSSTDHKTLIPYGPLYEQEVVKQVGEKWAHKHISQSAVEYVLNLIDYGDRSLPRASDPEAWIASEYTLSNFKHQLCRVRPNLAQGSRALRNRGRLGSKPTSTSKSPKTRTHSARR